MGLNLGNLMKQVQNVQKKASEAQARLASMELIGESANGGVKVTMDGQGKFKSIKLSAEVINPENPSAVDTDTIEMLEDVISAAINDATQKASKEMESTMKNVTGGMKIPGLNF
ncbi:YbaB/EbfC family nucleoid-associated protein [bacterium]|jgi:DNA-binding YbaB/EbfC family protein|nr:YbaB/EbfC family nucleoid-associated protein [bacterium]MBR1619462.1 YbaB/EbfC family nucleoid-associated protein [bacterium]